MCLVRDGWGAVAFPRQSCVPAAVSAYGEGGCMGMGGRVELKALYRLQGGQPRVPSRMIAEGKKVLMVPEL